MLAFASTSVLAEWNWVIEDQDMGMTVYVDSVSTSKKGNVAQMVSLINFQTPQIRPNYRFQSQAELSEYDCKESKSRLLSFSRYSKRMGEGEMVFSDKTPANWKKVAPGSAGEVLFEFACGIKSVPKFK